MTVKSTTSNTLIVNCLKDDYDQEMARMSALIANINIEAGKKVTVVDIERVATLQGVFDQVIFVSHHRYYDPNLQPIPIHNRSIGGYDLDTCAKAICKLIHSNKVSEIQFYGCEIATDRDSYDPVNPEDRTLVKKIFRQTPPTQDNLISSLHYICNRIFGSLLSNMNYRSVTVRGINGMGYIKPEFNAAPLGFDQMHLKEIRDISKEEDHNPKRKKQRMLETREDQFYRSRVASRKCPHQIEYYIDITESL